MSNKKKLVLYLFFAFIVTFLAILYVIISNNPAQIPDNTGTIHILPPQNDNPHELEVTLDVEEDSYEYLSYFTNIDVLSPKYLPYGAISSIRYDTDFWLNSQGVHKKIQFTIVENGTYENKRHPEILCTTHPDIGTVSISWNTINREYEYALLFE